MRLKNYAYRCLAVVCAIVAVSCVDKDFSVDKVSTEVSVFEGKTVLPIGTFEKCSLGDLLGDSLSDLRKEDGTYSFSEEQEPKSLSEDLNFNLDELKSFTLEEVASDFDINLPSITFDAPAIEIDAETAINTDIAPVQNFLSTLASYGIPVNTTEGTIPEDMSLVQQFWPEFAWPEFETTYEETYTNKFTFDVPEQISGVETIYFEDIDEGYVGAPFRLAVDLNGLAGISNGGEVNIELGMPAGATFTIFDKSDSKTYEDIPTYSKTIEVAPGQERIELDIYFASISTSVGLNEKHQFDMELGMTCGIGFKFGTKAGSYDLNQKPTIDLHSEFKVKDAAVKFASGSDLMKFTPETGFDIPINGLPEQLKSINRITLTDNTALNLFIDGFDALRESGQYISVDMTLPEFLDLNAVADAGYEYNAETHTLTTTLTNISDGLVIDFAAIDFGEGLAPVDGAVHLSYQPEIRVYFNQEEAINVMSFLPKDEATGEPLSELHVKAGIAETVVGLESVTAKIDLGEDMTNIEETVSLEGLADLKDLPIQISGSGLSPVIIIEITNPITLAPHIEASITPMTGEVADSEKAFSFVADIRAAEYVDGAVVPATTKLVLARSDREAEFPASEGYDFHSFDNIDNLIKTPIADSIAISASVELPNDGLIELHLSDNIDIKFGYKVEVPFAFDSSLNISYEDSISLVDETTGKSSLADVADLEGIEVGDLALILDIETTLPLELEATTKLLDKDGNELATKLGFGEENNSINGSKDGVTPERSTLRLAFDLESGKLTELADVESIALSIAARSASEAGAVALNDQQYISADLKLEIDGGVTVDISKLTE